MFFEICFPFSPPAPLFPLSRSCDISKAGLMDGTSISCLVNSISRFILLVSCQTRIHAIIQKDYRNMVMVLKYLKPVLDDVVDYELTSAEILYQECEELDAAVNEAREFIETWSPKMSKIRSVQKSGALLMEIQRSSLEICHILCMLLQSAPNETDTTGIQNCMQELQSLKQESLTLYIEEALTTPRNDNGPCSDHVMKVIGSFNLTSNRDLLKESVAVEKERMNVNKEKGNMDKINQVVDLLCHIRACLLRVECSEPESGVRIPPYFRCPLSLELMLDPVIVASGQTYERSAIQKWLDHGLTVCPKTRQTLSHKNLIPNYTVKAMIANWCQENNVKLSSESAHGKLMFSPSSDPGLFRSVSVSYSADSSSKSSPRSSIEVQDGFVKHEVNDSPRFSEQESNGHESVKNGISEYPSRELSDHISRSASASSAVSSTEYGLPSKQVSRTSSKHDISGEIMSKVPASPNKESMKQSLDSGRKPDVSSNGNFRNRVHSVLPDHLYDDLTTASHVEQLIQDLKSQSDELQTAAAAELRFLTKHNKENRAIVAQSGAIPPLLTLLYTQAKITQEHAVTALLNLSIYEENKNMIAEAGAIEPLIHVLNSGSDTAKENSAATLFSLSVLEEYKAKIGRSGAVKALVNLLSSGTLRGKKDAATALFNLSIFHENKARIVQAGAVKHLVELMEPATGMVDKAVALLANLSTIGEGRLAISRAGGIPLLVEVVESGSQRGKENAASVLVQLCLNNPKYCTLVLQEGAVPPLVALSQSGTPRAREKAQLLLGHFRNQREGNGGKAKS
ncbi:U-box domain-containing protein 3 [Linum perenne]